MDRRHTLALDLAVALAVGLVIVAGDLLHAGQSARPLVVGLGVAAAATLLARRRWPVLALGVSGALVAVMFHIDRSAGALGVFAPAVALYSLALRRGRRQQLLAALAAVAAVLVADLLHPGRPTVLQTLGHVALVTIPLLAAEAIRTHRSYLSVLLERLELSERAREQEAERRVQQERMRIARDLHDVVAHTLTEINVQAAAAAERAVPGDARAALERIELASHGAIGELRAVLGVLRDPEAGEPPRAPAPGLMSVGELVGQAREAGLEVRLEVNGEEPGRVSDAVALAAYRIVQESLTNARRHASGAAVRVILSFCPAELQIAIQNGAGIPANGDSHPPGVGIAGMRERAAALGGRVEAGADDGGFRVLAALPYEPEP